MTMRGLNVPEQFTNWIIEWYTNRNVKVDTVGGS